MPDEKFGATHNKRRRREPSSVHINCLESHHFCHEIKYNSFKVSNKNYKS